MRRRTDAQIFLTMPVFEIVFAFKTRKRKIGYFILLHTALLNQVNASQIQIRCFIVTGQIKGFFLFIKICAFLDFKNIGAYVLRQYRLKTNDATPTVLLATASPYKFAADVLRGVAGMNAAEGKDAFACSEELEKLTGVPMPAQVRMLKDLPVRHTAVCKRDAMGEAVLEAFK